MIYLSGKYAEDRHIMRMVLSLFGNLTVLGLIDLINQSPLNQSFGCHLGGCNLPGGGVRILTARKDCEMNISNNEKKENIIKDLLNDLYLSLFVLNPINPEDIKRFRKKGLNALTEVLKHITENY
jgi:hypothetical protein